MNAVTGVTSVPQQIIKVKSYTTMKYQFVLIYELVRFAVLLSQIEDGILSHKTRAMSLEAFIFSVT